MKKLLLFLPILLFVANCFGQTLIVEDVHNATLNEALVNMQTKSRLDQIKALQQDAQSLSFIQKTMKLAEDANKYRKEISKAIRSTKRITIIIKSQVELLEAYQKYGITMDFKDIMDYTNEQQREDIKRRYKNIITESDKDIEELEQIITPGNMEMEDYERLESLNKIEKRMLMRAYSIKKLTNSVKASIRINKREANTITLNDKLF